MSRYGLIRLSIHAPLAALLVFGTTACGNIWTTPAPADYSPNDQQVAAPEESSPGLSTTGASAAVGAVIGGTAGLIIGSSTGNAGEGVLLGSLTGAAVGGLIGNEIENVEGVDAEQDDVLQRHEEILKKQQREIQNLKQMGGDDQMAAVRPMKRAAPKAPAPVLASKPPAPVLAPNPSIATTDMINKREIKHWLPKDNQPSLPPAARGRLKEDAVINTPEGKRVYLKAPSQPLPNSRAKTVSKKPAAKKTQVAKRKPKPVVEREIVSHPPKKAPVKAVKTPVPQKSLSTTARPAPRSSSSVTGKCMLAETEAERARNAASDADKLFYYRRAIQLCPTTAVYHIEIGRVYIDIGRQEDAEFEFRRALDLDPDNRQAQIS